MAALLWTYAEQQTIKPISANQAQAYFNQLAEEVQVEDLQKLIGFRFYQDIIQNPATTANAALLDGGSYVGGDGVTYFYEGLKHVLAYFLFARYIKVSYKKDTYGGFVKKNFEESNQINKGSESDYHNDFRKIAFKYWEECECFIKNNSTDYPYYYSDPPTRSCWPGDNYNRSFCF